MKNRTQLCRAILFVCAYALFISLPAAGQQIAKGITSSTGDHLGFLEYKPRNYQQKTTDKYPLIIFLHGIGERGNGTTELKNVANYGLPRIIRAGHNMQFTWNGKTETFLVLSPQCPKKYGMWPQAYIDDLIGYAKKNLRIDPDRIYLTGLSMGGGGTYKYLSNAEDHPKNITAAATICAPCVFNRGAYIARAGLPLWSFHALDDNTAKAACTIDAINKINWEHPLVKPLLTLWPTGGHAVWDRVYADTAYTFDGVINIYEWFLGQRKGLPVNKLPVANAGTNLTVTTSPGTALLDASASRDADGKLVRYVWKKLSGPAAGKIVNPFSSEQSTMVTGLNKAGIYTYQLSVVDDRAGVARDTVVITVKTGTTAAPNRAPLADAGRDTFLVEAGNPIQLDGRGSSDTDGRIVFYRWTKEKGPDGIEFSRSDIPAPLVSGWKAGDYEFRLTVQDDDGAAASDIVKVKVVQAPVKIIVNQPPVADAGEDFDVVAGEASLVLDGRASLDSDGALVSFQWKEIAGGSVAILDSDSIATAVSSFSEGEYYFELAVTDDRGATSRDSVRVTVRAAKLLRGDAGVYPNPAHGFFFVQLLGAETGIVSATLYNAQGARMLQFTDTKSAFHYSRRVNASALQPGVYYLHSTVGKSLSTVSQVIVR